MKGSYMLKRLSLTAIYKFFGVNKDNYPKSTDFLQAKGSILIHLIISFVCLAAGIINTINGLYAIAALELGVILPLIPLYTYLFRNKKYSISTYIIVLFALFMVYAIAFGAKNDITILAISPLVITLGVLTNGLSLGLLVSLLSIAANIVFMSYTDYMSPNGKSTDYLNLVIAPFFTFLGAMAFSYNLKKAYEEADKEKERSFQSARLASLGSVTGGIAHEINNPLALIQMSLDLIKVISSDQSPAIAKNYEIIDRGVIRIKSIINMMLILCGHETKSENKRVSLNTLVSNLLESLPNHDLIENISHKLPEKEVIIEKNESYISQALAHILSNAIYYAALDKDKKGDVSVSYAAGVGFIDINVADNGPGVLERDRERIFDPFVTTKPIGTGPGLGLSIAQALLKQQCGDLFLKQASNPTIFCLRIPVKEVKDLKDKAA